MPTDILWVGACPPAKMGAEGGGEGPLFILEFLIKQVT